MGGGPKFPLDVAENIARCIHDDKPTSFHTLENLSLVDRHFRQAGQRYIFRRFVIDAGRTDLDDLLATLAKNRQIANYVQELYIPGLDFPPPHPVFGGRQARVKPQEHGEKWLPGILHILRASPITHLRLDVDPVRSHLGHDKTPVLLAILNKLKDLPFFANLRHLQLRDGIDVNLGVLRSAPLLRSLELHNVSLEPSVSDLAKNSLATYSPQRLERVVLLCLGNGTYHSNWDGHEKFFDTSSLRFLAVSCDNDNNYDLALDPIVSASVNSLTKLVLQVWNYAVLSEMDTLQNCTALVNLTLWFHDCDVQIEANEEEDDEGFLMNSFHPPISIQTLQLAFTWEDGIIDVLKDWCNKHFPELDQNIADNYDVLWPNLRSIGFRFVWDQDNELASPRPFPLRANHFKEVASKGVSINVLRHAGENDMLK